MHSVFATRADLRSTWILCGGLKNNNQDEFKCFDSSKWTYILLYIYCNISVRANRFIINKITRNLNMFFKI